MEILIIAIVASLVLNIFMFHKMSKKNGFVNPMEFMMVIIPFLGTFILTLLWIMDTLDEHYKK